MKSANRIQGKLPRLETAGLVERAVEAIRRHILANHSGTSGYLFSQGELSQSLGVSRSVVREAMRILQSQGLVEISQGRRPRVKPAGTDAVIDSLTTLLKRSSISMLDLVEVRIPLETEIAALAAERHTEEDVAALKAAVGRLEEAAGLERQVEADVHFHQLLAKATGNKIFDLLLEILAQLLKESRRRTISESGVEVPIQHHTAILKAVEKGSALEARRAMLYHLTMAKRDIVKMSQIN